MRNLVSILLTSQITLEQFVQATNQTTTQEGFNNQTQFIQMRNEMNEDNEKHHDMYEALNDKLFETGYIETAANDVTQLKQTEVKMVQSSSQGAMTDEEAMCYLNKYPDVVQAVGLGNVKDAKKHWEEKGKKQKRTKTCDAPLTDEEAQCYISRYPDLSTLTKINGPKADPLKVAKKHYMEWGIYEGRNRNCAQRITDQQAQCYLDQNDDIRKKLGDDNWVEAKEHWYSKGWKEGREYKCTANYNGQSIAQPYLCASEGGDCACAGGTVFFTKFHFSADKKALGSSQAEFDQALNYAFIQTDPVHDSFKCDSKMVGDMAPGFQKQCFCEKKIPQKPKFCAEGGESCQCPAGKQIFYGAKSDKKKVGISFMDMVDGPYAYAISKGDAVMCISDNFGSDPLPMQSKQCYCDQDDYYRQEWIDNDMAELAAKRAQEEAERQQKIAEDKIKAAEAEAKRAAAEAKALAEKATKARIKKIQDARDAADKIRDAAEAQAKKLREKAAKKEKDDQDAAQAAELAADEAEHQAELDRLAAIQAEKDAENANALERAEKRLEAHKKRIEAEEKKAKAEETRRRAREAAKQAEVEARIEKQRIATEEAQKKLAAIQARDDQVAKAAADAARADAIKAKQSAMAQAQAEEAERTQAAVEAQVMAALEEFQRAEAAKAAARQAEKDRIAEEQRLAEEKERLRILAEEEAEKVAEEKAKAAAKQAKEDAIAAEKAAYKAKKEDEAEARRLQEEAHKQKVADEQARHEELMAEKAEALAKGEDEIEAARQRRERAQERVRQAEEQRQKIADQKRELEERKVANELREQLAKENEQKAIAAQKAAEEKIKIAKEQAEAGKKRAKERMEKAAEETKANQERLEKEKKANIKKLAEMAEKQRIAIKKAQEAHQLAHEQAVIARAAQEARQLADHEEKMAKRRANFADQYPHVYIAKDTKITQIQCTFPDLNTIDNLLPIIWHHNMVADIEIIAEGIIKTFVRNNVMMSEDGDFKLIFTTADEKVDELKQLISETSFPNDQFFDFVTFKPATGNKNYIAWVRKQTLTLGHAGEIDHHDDDDEDDDEPPMLPVEAANSTEAAAAAGTESSDTGGATEPTATTTPPASTNTTSGAQTSLSAVSANSSSNATSLAAKTTNTSSINSVNISSGVNVTLSN